MRLDAPGLLPLLFLAVACRGGGPHRDGDRMWSVQAQYGHPVPGQSIFGEVVGDAPTGGLGVFHHWYVEDRVALGLGLTPTLYFQDGGTAFGTELDLQLRWHCYEVEGVALFVDVQGGFMLTTEDVPPDGTPWSFTYGFGPGFEVPLDNRWRLLGGVLIHHFSNGKGLGVDVPENPSQNEVRGWLGIGWSW